MTFPARLILSLFVCLSARAAEETSPILPAVQTPAPALVRTATREKLPITGIAASAPAVEATTNVSLSSADQVVLLIAATDGKITRQWLMELRGDKLTADEQATPAPTPKTIHTSTGRTFTFSSRPAALSVRLFGPVVANAVEAAAPTQAKSVRLLVNIDFLRAGFARNAAVAMRLHENKVNLPYHLGANPFPADRTAKDSKVAFAAGLHVDDERAIAATGPALTEFLNVIGNTPVLKDILFQVMEMPSAMGWLRGGATGFFFDPPTMARLDGVAWQLPGQTVYRAPFRYFLKSKPAMTGAFYFVDPVPPLLPSAGIVGLVAESPSQPEKKVELRVLSAQQQ